MKNTDAIKKLKEELAEKISSQMQKAQKLDKEVEEKNKESDTDRLLDNLIDYSQMVKHAITLIENQKQQITDQAEEIRQLKEKSKGIDEALNKRNGR